MMGLEATKKKQCFPELKRFPGGTGLCPLHYDLLPHDSNIGEPEAPSEDRWRDVEPQNHPELLLASPAPHWRGREISPLPSDQLWEHLSHLRVSVLLGTPPYEPHNDNVLWVSDTLSQRQATLSATPRVCSRRGKLTDLVGQSVP